ncbi:NAD-dependent succinate-semialdehyde dehydrogenase [Catenovulum sp. 2E275]|uniref:NAD-dependent succinate-semialdehyde dehydrogenase n=1 Tax=Catenovulum sp. 2E275 TaxID=2980497 RepID=UPI0021D29862|nr:NAD-dependent succinate-semialdehyde dehydrogenase [Catenovulum sp. 2E275]MCU4676426.1 NAD-dependent succinate-semialdehyde dehydrogenase [Catenovulum sp. 2E275]
MLIATNPYTGKKIAEYPSLNVRQIADCIGDAAEAFGDWKNTSIAERAIVLNKVAAELKAHRNELAVLMAEEMGKPVKEGLAEVDKSAWCAEHYATYANDYLANEVLESDAGKSYVCYQPLGTLLGILPWNAPLWIAFRYLAPALMAGNTCVMKHDPNVPGCAQALADIFNKAGVPQGVMVNLPVQTADVEMAIRDPRIAAISFTGSSAAGKKVAAIAASELKPAVLELGGSDPCIVLADADLEQAASIAVLSRIINAGQSCIAAKRIIVEDAVYDDFIALVKNKLSHLTLGNPLEESTQIGPLARKDLQKNLHRQVCETISSGAKCLLGGELPNSDGFFYPATLLVDASPEMTAFKEETFGPVMLVIKATDQHHALELANQTDYGLGAAVWSKNTALAEQLALQINSGQVAINGIVKTDPRLPSGGIKQSGYGRELGPHGIKEFVNAKQVWIK